MKKFLKFVLLFSLLCLLASGNNAVADDGPKPSIAEDKVNELKVCASCLFYESEKQSIPYRWKYSISDESLIRVSSDEIEDTSGANVMPGGDTANRKITFTALAPGECEITLRYVRYGEEWDGEFIEELVYRIAITEE